MTASIDINGFTAFVDRLIAATESQSAQPVPRAWVGKSAGDAGEDEELPTGLAAPRPAETAAQQTAAQQASAPGRKLGTQPRVDRGDLLLSLVKSADGHHEQHEEHDANSVMPLADALEPPASTSQLSEFVVQQIIQTIGLE